MQSNEQKYHHDSRNAQSNIHHVWSTSFLTITQISCTNTFLSFERKGSSFMVLVGQATFINILARIGISFSTRVSWTTFMNTELFLCEEQNFNVIGVTKELKFNFTFLYLVTFCYTFFAFYLFGFENTGFTSSCYIAFETFERIS